MAPRADLTSGPQRTFVPNLVLVSQFARLVPLSAPLEVAETSNCIEIVFKFRGINRLKLLRIPIIPAHIFSVGLYAISSLHIH